MVKVIDTVSNKGRVSMERIITVSGINGTELLRSLAAHGINTLGLRIMSPAELARTALMRSGISCGETFLPRKDEAALIDTFIRQTPYFASASFADAENMAAALFSLRSMIVTDEKDTVHGRFANGEFPEKNTAITEVYDHYMEALGNRGLIDTIGIIRKAVSEAKPLTCEVITLSEFELTPLETVLVEHLGGKTAACSLADLFGTAEKACVRNVSYLESYGSANEVEYILAEIADGDIPYDRCTIAVTETSGYAQLFYEYSQTHGIDMSFGCGIPITNSYPARLLRALYTWDTTGYHGSDALNSVIFGESADRAKIMETVGVEKYSDLKCLTEMLGNLKCGRDSDSTEKKLGELKSVYEAWMSEKGEGLKNHRWYEVNDKLRLMEAARRMGAELAKGYSYFIRTYSVIRKEPAGRIDRAAVNVICSAIDAYVGFSGGDEISELVPEILNKTVCSEPSREGALYVTGIGNAFSALRSRMYILGLSADNYPGKPSENYLLLDSDYEMFGTDMPTSANRIKAKKRNLTDLIKLACSLDIPVKLSYSDYNAAQMSNANPSSVLYEIYKEEHGECAGTDNFEKAFDHTGYFNCQAAPADEIGEAYTEGCELKYEENVPEADDFSVAVSQKGYAPTTLETFFKCPRSYLLGNVIGIEDEEPVDPFAVIDARQFGTLAHGIMEWLAQMPSRPSRTEFVKRAGVAYDDFLKEFVPLNEGAAQREKKRFLDVMGYAYDLDPGNGVLSAEEKKTVEHESGIKLYGYPDRVEKDHEGHYLIADFKTGRNIVHIKDDIDSCLQVVIYAYMMEKLGISVSYGEYRYLRKHKQISCVFNDDMKQKLNDKLTEFRNALKNGDFPVNTGGDKFTNCKYCTFADICGREEKEAQA